MKHLLNHYFNKVIDLKESSRENDEIIFKLDVSKLINSIILVLNEFVYILHLYLYSYFDNFIIIV